MKSVFLALLISISINASSQTDNRIFYSQLMVVFSDLDKNFEFLKGELKDKEGNDSLFVSNSTLEGTKENTIFSSSNAYAYQAMISDSVSEAGSQYILKAWKEKLTAVLTGSFSQLEKEFHSEKDQSIDGYQYSSEAAVVLLLRHKTDNGPYWINLVIKAK